MSRANRRKSASNCLAFSITEVLIALLIASVVTIFLFKTFSSNKTVFERGSTKASLQQQAISARRSLENYFGQAGANPCFTPYWNEEHPTQQADTLQIAYSPAHPWGGPNDVLFSGATFTPNPFQAVIIHKDEKLGGEPGTPGCDSTGIQLVATDGKKWTVAGTDYFPAQPGSAELLFVNNIKDSGGSPAFDIECSNFADNTLLALPIIYEDTMPSEIFADCSQARVIVRNVECFYVDYLFPPALGGTCGSSSPDPETQSCKLDADSYDTAADRRIVNKLRVYLTLKANSAERGYKNPGDPTLCNSDPILPTGPSMAGEPFRTINLRRIIPLPLVNYRS